MSIKGLNFLVGALLVLLIVVLGFGVYYAMNQPISGSTPTPTQTPSIGPEPIPTATPTIPSLPYALDARTFYPEPESTNVPLNTTIAVTITQEVNITLLLTPYVMVSSVSWTYVGITDRLYTFHLTEELETNTSYTATVRYSNNEGGKMASWSFTTSDEAIPTPTPTPTIPLPITAYDFYPACNATNVPLNPTIQVTISRPTLVNLSLTPFVAVLNVTEETVGVASGRYTFILVEPLQPNTLYQATISFGNSRSWNFTTTSSPVPEGEKGHLTIVETSHGKLFTASTPNTEVHRVTFWVWKESVNDREADFRILSYPNWNGTHMTASYEFLKHGEWWTVNAQFSTHSYYFWSNTVTFP